MTNRLKLYFVLAICAGWQMDVEARCANFGGGWESHQSGGIVCDVAPQVDQPFSLIGPVDVEQHGCRFSYSDFNGQQKGKIRGRKITIPKPVVHPAFLNLFSTKSVKGEGHGRVQSGVRATVKISSRVKGEIHGIRTTCVVKSTTTFVRQEPPPSPPPLPSDLISIDFGPNFGAPLTSVQLTDQLQQYGVSFSSTSPMGVIWNGEDPQASFRFNFSAGFNSQGFGDTAPIRIDFVHPVTREPTTASNVSIRAFDGGHDLDVLTLSAFNNNNQLIGSQSVGPDGFIGGETFGGNTLQINQSGIAYVILETSNTVSGLFFDDLSFRLGPAPVPPPNNPLSVGFEDTTVSVDYHFPAFGTILYRGGSADVRHPLRSFITFAGQGIQIEIEGRRLTVNYLGGWHFTTDPKTYDGPVVSVTGTTKQITGIASVQTRNPGYNGSQVTFDSSHIYINQLGFVDFPPLGSISIIVNFDR